MTSRGFAAMRFGSPRKQSGMAEIGEKFRAAGSEVYVEDESGKKGNDAM